MPAPIFWGRNAAHGFALPQHAWIGIVRQAMSGQLPDPLLQKAFQTAAVGMALVALDGRFLRVNDALCSMLGYSADELLARTDQELTFPDDLQHDRPKLERILRGEVDRFFTEKRYFHKKGHAVWVSVTNSLVRDDLGQAQCFFTQLQDITLQQEAELARDRFFQLPLAMHFVIGFDGYFKRLSPSWTDALGYSVDYLLSIPYMDMVHPDDREKTAKAAQQVEAGENVFLFENRYLHRDGGYRWILWAAVSVVQEQTVYGVALDYTSRKETELELERTLGEMERLVTELKASHQEIDTLRQGLLTVCSWTKQVQHEGRWMSIDEFLRDHLRLKLTHGISQEGVEKVMAELKAAGGQRS